MASPYRDRTAEFRSLSQTLLGGRVSAVNNNPQNDHVFKSPPPPLLSSRSKFNRKASLIGSGIHETSQKIVQLAKSLSDLQTLQNMEIADGNYSEDRVVLSTTVCDDLKNKIMGATKHFQDVLTARTENIKAETDIFLKYNETEPVSAPNKIRD